MKEIRKKNQEREKVHPEQGNNTSINHSRRKVLKTGAAGTAAIGTMALVDR